NVEQKGKSFVPFLAKYVFMTSHKPPEEAFNFRRVNMNDETSTQRDWGQFYRRLDYIIEFKGMWHDELDQRTTELIFHKGSEENFRNMLWDVKYDEGEYTCEELRTIIQELNKDQDGEVIIKSDQRLKSRIEQFINDSNRDDVNISNSCMMLDDNYFVQRPVEVIEMTDKYASSQDRSVLTWREIIEKQNEESRRLNRENVNI
ncbi:9026_t:CDS:2, partial [Dentiscutata heterogama]